MILDGLTQSLTVESTESVGRLLAGDMGAEALDRLELTQDWVLQWRIRAIEIKPATQIAVPTVNVQVIHAIRHYSVIRILDLVQVGLGCSQLGLHAGIATIVLKLCHDFFAFFERRDESTSIELDYFRSNNIW